MRMYIAIATTQPDEDIMDEPVIRELTVEETESVSGGILFLVGALAVKLIEKTGHGFSDSTGSPAMDALVGGNLGA